MDGLNILRWAVTYSRENARLVSTGYVKTGEQLKGILTKGECYNTCLDLYISFIVIVHLSLGFLCSLYICHSTLN